MKRIWPLFLVLIFVSCGIIGKGYIEIDYKKVTKKIVVDWNEEGFEKAEENLDSRSKFYLIKNFGSEISFSLEDEVICLMSEDRSFNNFTLYTNFSEIFLLTGNDEKISISLNDDFVELSSFVEDASEFYQMEKESLKSIFDTYSQDQIRIYYEKDYTYEWAEYGIATSDSSAIFAMIGSDRGTSTDQHTYFGFLENEILKKKRLFIDGNEILISGLDVETYMEGEEAIVYLPDYQKIFFKGSLRGLMTNDIGATSVYPKQEFLFCYDIELDETEIILTNYSPDTLMYIPNTDYLIFNDSVNYQEEFYKIICFYKFK